MGWRLAMLTLLLCSAGMHSVQAQRSRCYHSTITEEAGEASESWSLDGTGRVRRFSEDNYFYGRSEAYRYDGRGRLTHRDLLEYSGGGVVDFEPRGPVPVRTRTEGELVIQESENLSWTDRQATRFDDEGRPSRVDIRRDDSDQTTTFECTYDLAGRPIHARAMSRRAGRVEWDTATRWQWREGRLTRVIHESDQGDRVFEVHHRGNGVHLVSATESERETWTGSCAPVFFGACSPALIRRRRVDGVPECPRSDRARPASEKRRGSPSSWVGRCAHSRSRWHGYAQPIPAIECGPMSPSGRARRAPPSRSCVWGAAAIAPRASTTTSEDAGPE